MPGEYWNDQADGVMLIVPSGAGVGAGDGSTVDPSAAQPDSAALKIRTTIERGERTITATCGARFVPMFIGRNGPVHRTTGPQF